MTRSFGSLRRITQPISVATPRQPRTRHAAVRDLGFRCFRLVTGRPVELARTRNTMMAFVR
jgi:hypothetical protein